MENDATSGPPSTDSERATSPTTPIERSAAATWPGTSSGLAETAINCATPAPSSLLSADERTRLLKMRGDRRRGWMLTMSECDFLLELTERML